ncbi:MAG TPA: asparagine synthase (glutamine-hydrolyzing) [Bacillota bacterium]|nr:asparagine synthase (glutamine-hydrolyzing) [Bacillota bacterium]
MRGFIGKLRNHPDVADEGAEQNNQSNDEKDFDDEYVSFELENNHQPLRYADESVCVVLNGTIYNDNDLRHDLYEKGYELTSDSPAEVIAALFSKHRENVFRYLRGMFAILIWDKREKTLYGARDPFGIKPLFYRETDWGVVFASEKKNITLMMETEKLNLAALQHYLSFQYVPEPMTMTEGIKKVEPGHYFIKQPEKAIVFKQYWHVTFDPLLMDEDAWVKRIQDAMYDSVEAHMQSDVPVGSFLSGGIDSTLIAAIAQEINPAIQTFSVGFEREGYSEIDVAKETAAKLGIDNISYTISPEEYVEVLPHIMWCMDDPLADPACVPLYFAAREAKKHVDVVLSGEGSDELFGGYNIYREPEALRWFNFVPSPAKNLLAKVADALPEGVRGKSFLQRGTTPLAERYIGNAKMFTEEEKRHILKHYDDRISNRDITGRLFDEAAAYPPADQMQYIDIHTWMRGDILLKAERMTMAHSLETRLPFLDRKVFQVAREIPSQLKIAHGTTKYILREASRGIIPDHVLDRKKLGFPVPIRHWLKNELNSWAKRLIQESQTDYLLHKAYVMELLDAHCQGKGDYSRKIWTVLMFMLWHQIFIENDHALIPHRIGQPE